MKNTDRSSKILRKSFYDADDDDLIPDLVSLQRVSYEQFLGRYSNHANSGLTRAFKAFFPLVDASKTVTLDFVSYRLGEERSTYKECLHSDKTFSIPLYATIRLVIWD